MPRKRSALSSIALFWLGGSFVLTTLLVVGAFIGSPSRVSSDGWFEGWVGPWLYLWGFYGVVPSLLLLVGAFFVRAFRLRGRRAA